MREYKVIENFSSLTQNTDRLNKMAEEGWIVKSFTDHLTLMERDKEVIGMLNEGEQYSLDLV